MTVRGKAEDQIFSKRVDKAWKRYDTGQFVELSKDEFLEELANW